jgi:hypothetical protein
VARAGVWAEACCGTCGSLRHDDINLVYREGPILHQRRHSEEGPRDQQSTSFVASSARSVVFDMNSISLEAGHPSLKISTTTCTAQHGLEGIYALLSQLHDASGDSVRCWLNDCARASIT